MITDISVVPVRRSVVLKTGAAEAFELFTQGVDSWWPRTHHIGNTAMVAIVIEPQRGGRCYTRHEDGVEFVWGTVMDWEPPRRVIFAWQITHDFRHQPDLSRASEVEVRFVAIARNRTRVELEHRGLERHAADAGTMRQILDGPNGWTKVLATLERPASK